MQWATAEFFKTSESNMAHGQEDDSDYVPDVSMIQDIERFIRFVEARSCRFHVWKVIPLDADLLGMVLRFTATYLIIIIQFTI